MSWTKLSGLNMGGIRQRRHVFINEMDVRRARYEYRGGGWALWYVVATCYQAIPPPAAAATAPSASCLLPRGCCGALAIVGG